PGAQGEAAAAGRRAERRAAADGGHGPRADEQAAAVDAGRAVGRPQPALCARDLRAYRRRQQGGGRDPDGRAERAAGAGVCVARLRARTGTEPLHRHRARADRRSRSREKLSRGLKLDQFIFFLNKVMVPGLVTGSVYALGAIGVTLIFGILRFAHFAHGDMMTMGSYFAWVMATALAAMGIVLPIPLGFVVLPVSMALTAVVALGLDWAFYAPLRRRGAKPVTLLIASIGVTLMIQGLVRLIFGSSTRDFFVGNEEKVIYRIDLSALGGTRPLVISQPQIMMWIVTAIVVLALHYFLTRSRLGKGMRAMSDNPDLAQVSGINTQLVVIVTWIIAGALACLAGTMLALDVNLRPDLAFNIILPIFAAAIVG